MKIRHISILISLFLLSMATISAQNTEPDYTYLFCEQDTCNLYMDVYNPTEQSQISTTKNTTVIFMFGGGFVGGSRYCEGYAKWFRHLNINGIRVISIDYRLGLKGAGKIGPKQVDLLDRAIHIAVEDLFCATNFIIENAEELEVDTKNIVICGSSAGAIAALQADYEICNETACANVLPQNFRYAGVISFAGAILSRNGDLKYAKNPAPTLMFHGTEDSIVPYQHIKSGKDIFSGSAKILKVFQKNGYNYNMYHFTDADHEVSGAFMQTVDFQLGFINENIKKNNPRTIEAWVADIIK